MECSLTDRKCKPCEGGVPPLTREQADEMKSQLDPAWVINEDRTRISRMFSFANYYETMAFVNALAFISHHEDHHPDLVVKYDSCEVAYYTHSIGGLSENDFICAAKADTLLNV